MKYYKILERSGRAPFVYPWFFWPLPKGNNPGKWLPAIKGELVMGRRGYHVLKWRDVEKWRDFIHPTFLFRPPFYEVEIRGSSKESIDEIVVQQARIIREVIL